MLTAAVLLTTSWLLGPPPEGQFEVYLGGSYAEAPRAHFDRRLGWQETQLQGGFAHNVDGRHTFRVQLPFIVAQTDYNGEIFYENRGVGRAQFSAERWITRSTQLGLGFGIPMGRSQRSLLEEYPDSGQSFPTLNDGSTRAFIDLSQIWKQPTWSMGGQFRLDASLDNGDLFPEATAIALYNLIPDTLRTGVVLRGAAGFADGAERQISVGLFEQLGPPKGLAGEFEITTSLHAENVAAATEARLTVVWRQ